MRLALTSALLTCLTTAAQAQNYLEITSRFTDALEASAYEVSEGATMTFGTNNCDALVSVLGTCFANNPAAPYTIILPPRSPAEYVDPYFSDFGGIVPEGLAGSFRLDADEAVVVIGRMPPRAAHFSVQSYVFSREVRPIRRLLDGNFEGLLEAFFGPSPNDSRFYLLASLSNSFNERVLAKAIAKPQAWNEEFAVITTANKVTASALKATLIASGLAAERIYVEALPASVKLGLDSTADDFMSVIRYALPEQAAAGTAWRNTPTLKVIRVNPDSPALSRYGEFIPDARSASSESYLRSSLDEVTAAVQAKLHLSGVEEPKAFLPVSSLGVDGVTCVERGMNCLGDTYDTDTYRVGGMDTMDARAVWAVVGVNHTVTGNSSYISLGLTDQVTQKGLQSVSQTGSAAGFLTGTMTGSAAAFLGTSASHLSIRARVHLNKFYVSIFARNCAGLMHCTTVTNDLPLDHSAMILQRAYIKPGTSRGADPAGLLSPMLIRGSH